MHKITGLSKLPSFMHQHTTGSKYQQATIIQTEAVSVYFTLVHIRNVQPVNTLMVAQEVQLHAGNNRAYKGTLVSVDTNQNVYSMLVYTGNRQTYNTPSITLLPGETVQIAIEKNNLYYQVQATHHFFFGDESAIGIFNAFIEIALDSHHEYFGVLECGMHGESVMKQLNLLLDCVPYQLEAPAQNAIDWMEDMHPNCWRAWQNAQFYLAGSQDLIIPFSEYLAAKQVTPLQIQLLDL